MRKRAFSISLVLSLLIGSALTGTATAASAVHLGIAAQFAVLGASTVTNTGPSIINGDLGVSPGLAVVGFPPGIVNGAIHEGDAVAAQAQADLTTAYNTAAGLQCDVNLTGQDLGGMTLTSGVYCFNSSAGLTGMLTLDAEGVEDAQFIFQVASTLTTASASRVRTINGVRACNVYWQIGSSATLGTATAFVGTIMAYTSVTVTTGATIRGRALAQNAAVTLDTNTITKPSCAGTTPPDEGTPGGEIEGPCNDPAYYATFDNSASLVPVKFRFYWFNTRGLHFLSRVVDAGAVFKTAERWVKNYSWMRITYKDSSTGEWLLADREQASKGWYPPCVYQQGYQTR